MNMQHRVLVVGRQQDDTDRVTSILESHAYIVTSTLNDDVAIDLAASAGFDALVVGSGVSHGEFASLREDVLRRQPDIKVVEERGADSVLTLLRQAFKGPLG